MQHLRCWITFTLDAFVTVINLIYKNIFFYQPFDGFSVINTIKLFAKKKKKKKESKYNFGRRSNNENKDIKYIN